MSKLLVDEIGGNAGVDTTIASGKKIAGTASQFKMSDVVQGDVLYGSAADTLSRLAPGTAGQVLQTQGAAANPVWAADAGGLFSSYAVIEEQTATTVNAGTFTSGAWRTRDLNTEVFDPDGIVTISSGQFTLGAGNYLIRWYASAFSVNSHKTRLYDVTGTASIGVGSSEWSGNYVTGTSTGSLRITPSGSNVYSIEHQCSATHSLQGLGVPAGFSEVEVFARVEILKES